MIAPPLQRADFSKSGIFHQLLYRQNTVVNIDNLL